MSGTSVLTSLLPENHEDASQEGGLGGLIEGSHLEILDGVVIAVYFLLVICVGIWASRRSKKENVGDYFLASRSMHFIPVGASLFASNIGSGHFVGLAGSAASSGIGAAGFEFSAIFILMILGWVFVPVYMSSGIYTMPEYLRERFGGQRIRVYLSFLALLLYIFTKISADLYAGAIFIQLALNKTSPEWMYISIFILLGIVSVFTIAGGLTAVIWTDFAQTILMIVGAFILMIAAFVEVGGLNRLIDEYPYAIAEKRAGNGTCGMPPSDFLNLFRPITPGASDYPWTGMVFGLSINSIWYWCTDQVIVQRTLASKNMSHAKGGCILAGYLKLLPLWLLLFPGMIARVLYPERVGCADPIQCMEVCGKKSCSDIAFPELVIKLLPSGLSGMMLAVMMAALMSSLTSIFNSASTIFTIDIYTRFRKNPGDKELIIVGRMFVLFLAFVSVCWVPVIGVLGNSQLFDYIQAITAFLAAPICAVFLLAVFWHRITEPGAFWGLMVGLAIGLLRFVLEYSFKKPECGSLDINYTPSIVTNVHYLHFSCILLVICFAVTIGVSLLTPPIPEKCLYRLTFWTRHSELKRTTIREYENEKRENENDNRFSIEEPTAEPSQPSKILKLFSRLFGGNNDSDLSSPPTNQQTERINEGADFLYEEPKTERFTNLNALICLVITVFFVGFFA